MQVDSLSNFHLPWKELLTSFRKGYTIEKWTGEKTDFTDAGYFIVRQLADPAHTDTMRSTVIQDFFNYRLNDREKRIRIQADEIQQLFSATFGSTEEARLVRTMQANLADVRGLNLAMEFGTIRPASLQPEILEYLTGFMFSELRESGAERTHSSRGRILESIRVLLSDSEKPYLSLVEKIMENVELQKHHLFFYLATDREGGPRHFRLVRPMLPPHAIEDPRRDPTAALKRFEQETGASVLRSANEVERIDLRGKTDDKGDKHGGTSDGFETF